MIGSTRSNFYGYMLLLCMLTLMLALAWPAAASAQPDRPQDGGPHRRKIRVTANPPARMNRCQEVANGNANAADNAAWYRRRDRRLADCQANGNAPPHDPMPGNGDQRR